MVQLPESERPTIESDSTVALDPSDAKPRLSLGAKLLRVGGIGLGLVGLAIIAGVLVWNSSLVQNEFDRPLGPTLALPQREAYIPADGSDRAFGGSDGADPNRDIGQESEIETYCDGPPEMTLLAVGADATSRLRQGGLADSIRVVRVDFVTPRISVLTIPRDTWVYIPGLGASGEDLDDYFGQARDTDGNIIEQSGNWGKINTAFLWGNAYGLPGGGPQVLAQTIYENFGITVDHYSAVNMEVMANAIDAVGGVDITVAYDIPGFDAGQYHMDGAQAVKYARVRSSDNDFYRTDRQNNVLLALRSAYSKPENYARIPQLADRFLAETQTDLSKSDVMMLSCIALEVERDQIETYALTQQHLNSSYTTGGSYILLIDEEQTQQVISEFLGQSAIYNQ